MSFCWSNRRTNVTLQGHLPSGGIDVRGMVANRENFVLSTKRLETTVKHYRDIHKIAFIPYWIDLKTRAVHRYSSHGIQTLLKLSPSSYLGSSMDWK